MLQKSGAKDRKLQAAIAERDERYVVGPCFDDTPYSNNICQPKALFSSFTNKFTSSTAVLVKMNLKGASSSCASTAVHNLCCSGCQQRMAIVADIVAEVSQSTNITVLDALPVQLEYSADAVSKMFLTAGLMW